MKTTSKILVGLVGLSCMAVGLLKYWVTVDVAIMFARTFPGTSDFYAAADKTATLSLLAAWAGAALLSASGISYLVGRKLNRRPNAA